MHTTEREILNSLRVGVVVHAVDTRIVYSNPMAAELLGLTEDQMRGKTAIDPAWHFCLEDGSRLAWEDYPVNRILKTKQDLKDLTVGVQRSATHDMCWVLVSGFPEVDPQGVLQHVVVSFHDITDRQNALVRLRQSEELFRTLAISAPVGIFHTDANGNCVYVNERWCLIAGMLSSDASGSGWTRSIHPDDRERVGDLWYQAATQDKLFLAEYRFMRPDQSVVWVIGQASAERDPSGKVVGYVGTITDISARKELESKLEHQAHYDFLTEVINRRRFMALAERELMRVKRYPAPLTLVAIDLDHFKAVNDQYGHDVGDQVLREFSQLCRSMLREQDLMALLGGEEFAFLFPQTHAEQAMEVVERMRYAIEASETKIAQGGGLKYTASFGVTCFRGASDTVDTLLTRADEALYQAKHEGRNRAVLIA